MKSNGGVRRKKGRTSSRSNKIEERCIPFFSEEIIFVILTFVPADILCSCMRYVCTKWNEIICDSRFKEQHQLHHPSRSSGLFFSQSNLGYFANVGKTEARMTELELPLHYKARAGYDGLLLLEHEIDRTIYIANPLTRRITKLPQFSVSPHRHEWSFVYIRSTKEYKVVLTYYTFYREPFKCAVLTLGKGCAWKHIQSREFTDYLHHMVSPRCVGGIVFWVNTHAPHIIGFCVESEATFRVPSPTVDDHEGSIKSYFSGEESLSLAIQCERRKLVEIWCLFNPKGVAGWRKMHKIDFGATIALYNIGDRNLPVTWVNKEVVIFHDIFATGLVFGHNVKNGKSIKIGESKCWLPLFCGEFVCGFTWIQLR